MTPSICDSTQTASLSPPSSIPLVRLSVHVSVHAYEHLVMESNSHSVTVPAFYDMIPASLGLSSAERGECWFSRGKRRERERGRGGLNLLMASRLALSLSLSEPKPLMLCALWGLCKEGLCVCLLLALNHVPDRQTQRTPCQTLLLL